MRRYDAQLSSSQKYVKVAFRRGGEYHARVLTTDG